MLWTGLALVGLLGIAFVIDVLGLPDEIGDVAGLLALVAFAVLPFAFLAGLVRSRYSRAGAVGELIERLNNPEADRSLGPRAGRRAGRPLAQARLLAPVGRATTSPTTGAPSSCPSRARAAR